MINMSCPCGKATAYAVCCGRFIEGGDTAKTPEQLMRSRYSAYALGGRGKYLLSTWFPATAGGLTAEGLSIQQVAYERLEVIDKSQQGDEGTVEFKAYFRKLDDGDELEVLHEISEFKRIQGRWYYVGRRVS